MSTERGYEADWGWCMKCDHRRPTRELSRGEGMTARLAICRDGRCDDFKAIPLPTPTPTTENTMAVARRSRSAKSGGRP